jgi:YfiH family protein
VPLLLGDRRTGVVAAIHAGWRGTAARVIDAALVALRRVMNGPLDVVAAIGPHIEACCFEVGDDVAATLESCSSERQNVVVRSSGNPRVDLRRILRAQLEEAGIAKASIDDVRGCTACDAGRFFSFRRDRGVTGRMLSAIVASGSGAAQR